MKNTTSCIRSRKVLFSAFLVLNVGCFALLQWKDNLLSHVLHDLQIKGFWVKDSDPIDSLTASQLMDILKWPAQKACERVGYYGGALERYDNMSFFDGQKAICLDKGTAPEVENCIVYSIGINNEWSFDEAMEKYGCEVFSFDPTMGQKEHDRTDNIHFYPIGLGAKNEVLELGKGKQFHSMAVDKNITTFKVMTLSSIYRTLSPMHGEEAVIDYLKFDIEWGEWNVIPELIESGILDKVRQMSIEIHLTNGINADLNDLKRDVKILQRLEKEGNMVRFDSKMNAYTLASFEKMGNITGAFAYEMAWYNRKYHPSPPPLDSES